MAAPIFILNGPNLNRLGMREPSIYGSETLADIELTCHEEAKVLGLVVDFRQSNHEGTLVDWIQEAQDTAGGIILNVGAYTHTSVAIHDALRSGDLPVIELHLSNVHAREDFRKHSYVSPVASGVIFGFGAKGYPLALRAMVGLLEKAKQQ